MIYQVLIDRFRGNWSIPPKNVNDFLGGTLKGIEDKLDYIKDLGTTVIWLSPFFKTEAYHGYHISDYEQVDPHFGTLDDLLSLIDAAHRKGMRIMADFVPNHCHSSHPFFQDAILNPSGSKYRSWFHFFNNESSDCLCFYGYPELPKLNLENPETAAYFIGLGTRLSEMGIDAFRIDHAVGIPLAFLKAFRDAVHGVNPESLVIGEAWACNMPRRFFKALYFRSFWKKAAYWLFGIKQEAIQLDYSGVLDGVLDFEFRGLLLDEIQAGNRVLDNRALIRRLDRHFSRYPSPNYIPVPFLDNHDTDRFLFDCQGDKELLSEALRLMQERAQEYVVYYGTEQDMMNTTTIVNAEPYADLRVREPMNWTQQ